MSNKPRVGYCQFNLDDNFMEQILKYIAQLNFGQATTISIGMFFADFVAGITASLRSGRHIKSSIMRESISKKMASYFFCFIIGLSFYLASLLGSDDISATLCKIGSAIMIFPAIPELLSIWENWKSIKTGQNPKPTKEDGK